MQRLLNHYLWDTDAMRDDVRDAVVEILGDPGRGVLILDETGFLKRVFGRPVRPASIRERPYGPRIPRWVSFWRMDPTGGGADRP